MALVSTPCRRVVIRTPRLKLSGLVNCGVAKPERGLILALHGGGYSAGYWNCPVSGTSLFTLAARLGFHVIAPDRVGYGLSKDVDPALAGLNNQVEILFDALEDWSRAHHRSVPMFVIGHSVGGILALLMAAHTRAKILAGVDVLGAPIRFRDNDAGDAVNTYPQSESHVPPLNDQQRKWLMFGPENTYEACSDRHDATLIRPMPVVEYREAIAMPGRWPAVLPAIKIPVQFTVAEHETMQATGPETLEEVRGLLSNSPHVALYLQRRSGHNASAHRIAPGYHLRALAFFEECLAIKEAP